MWGKIDKVARWRSDENGRRNRKSRTIRFTCQLKGRLLNVLQPFPFLHPQWHSLTSTFFIWGQDYDHESPFPSCPLNGYRGRSVWVSFPMFCKDERLLRRRSVQRGEKIQKLWRLKRLNILEKGGQQRGESVAEANNSLQRKDTSISEQKQCSRKSTDKDRLTGKGEGTKVEKFLFCFLYLFLLSSSKYLVIITTDGILWWMLT